MSTDPKSETPKVIDFLSDLDFSTPLVTQRVRLHRIRLRVSRQYISCQGCGQPLVKYGTWWGTDDVKKAICKECRATIKARSSNPTVSCQHPRLKHFKFQKRYDSLFKKSYRSTTIWMCPDCDTFDDERHSRLNFGEATNKEVIPRENSKRKIKDVHTLNLGVVPTITRPNMKGGSHPYEDHNHEIFDASKWKVVSLPVTRVNVGTPTVKELKMAYELKQIEETMREPAKRVHISNVLHSRSSTPSRAVLYMGPRTEYEHGLLDEFLRFRQTAFWPNAQERQPGHREVITGGKPPRIVAGNYKHSLDGC